MRSFPCICRHGKYTKAMNTPLRRMIRGSGKVLTIAVFVVVTLYFTACATSPAIDEAVPAAAVAMCPDNDPVPCPSHQECVWDKERQCSLCHCVDNGDPLAPKTDDAAPLPVP